MPMLPGHWAHPAYQSLFTKHKAENASLRGFADKNILADSVTATSVIGDLTSTVTDQFNVHDPELAFSGVNAAPSPPSDIHGGAFTLMFETGIKYDGYGILASTGTAGTFTIYDDSTEVLDIYLDAKAAFSANLQTPIALTAGNALKLGSSTSNTNYSVVISYYIEV